MSTLIDPRERFIHRTGLFMLSTSGVAAGVAALLHSRQADPNLIDLVVPSTFAASMLGLCAYLWVRPTHLKQVILLGYAAGVAALMIPAWLYPWQALQGGARLVDTLPPISAALIALVLAQIVFLRPRHALAAALLAWISVGGPILAYLAFHPDELKTPRGMDLLMALGPQMALMMIYIPFHRGIERWVDSLQRERAKMERLAERDGLTGLYNRRASESLLANLLAAPDGTDAVILFDIDRFKGINDTHGHPAGDEVLRQVARRCEGVLRRSDLFARWGGEEFLVLVRGATPDGTVRIAETMRVAISAERIEPAGTVTASFGVAPFRPYDTIATWLQRADKALYEAKATGRDRVVAAT